MGIHLSYSPEQIQAAKLLFELHEVCLASDVSDDHAIAFVEYYFDANPELPNSVVDAMLTGLENGASQHEDDRAFMLRLIEGEDLDSLAGPK